MAAEIAELQAADIAVAFIGGYHTEIALMARLARDRGYPVQLVAGISLATEEFGLIAGPAAEGTLFTDHRRPARTRRSGASRRAVPSVRFRARGLHPVRLWRRSGVGAGGRESRLAGAPGDDRIPAATPVRHRAGPDRLRREGRPHCAKPGMVCLARTARTCRWSKAWPRTRLAERVLVLSKETIELGRRGSPARACRRARARSCSAWASAGVCCWRSSGSARSR